jgi:hypothetical protein
MSAQISGRVLARGKPPTLTTYTLSWRLESGLTRGLGVLRCGLCMKIAKNFNRLEFELQILVIADKFLPNVTPRVKKKKLINSSYIDEKISTSHEMTELIWPTFRNICASRVVDFKKLKKVDDVLLITVLF